MLWALGYAVIGAIICLGLLGMCDRIGISDDKHRKGAYTAGLLWPIMVPAILAYMLARIIR